MGKRSHKAKAQAAGSAASTSASANALFGAQPSGSFDTELDAFFKAAPPPPPPSALPPSSTIGPAPTASNVAKRKVENQQHPSQAKKARSEERPEADQDDGALGEIHEADSGDEDVQEGDGDLSELDDAEMEAMADLLDADDSTDEVEDQLLSSKDAEEEDDEAEAEVDPELAEDPDRSDNDENELDNPKSAKTGSRSSSAFPVVHESLLKKGASKRKNAKFEEDTDEPSEVKDKRTLFIGNVPIEAVKSKSLQKSLQRHLTALSPYPTVTKITSLRFRSIPFAVPTDDFAADSEEAAAKLAKRRERSKNYKEALAAVEGKDVGSDSGAHQFLTAKQKRKVAYINQDLNSHADTVNAYVTLGYPDAVFKFLNRRRKAKQQAAAPSATSAAAAKAGTKANQAVPDRDVEMPEDEDLLAGFDRRLTAPVLAALIASVADGQLFEGRHLRVDLVKPLEPSEVIAAGLDKVTTAEGSLIGSASSGATDPKRTLFVGNLDFEAREEQIRGFFEKLLTDERGSPPDTLIPVVGLDGEPPAQPTLFQSKSSSKAEVGAEESLSDDDDDDDDNDDDDDDEDDRAAETSAATALALRAASWVRSVRVIRDKATQMGKGIAYVRFLDTECVDEIMAIHEAEEAFFANARGGGGGGKGISNTALASTAIAVGGTQAQFRRRLKLRGRALRVSRCKATTNSSRTKGNSKKRERTDGPGGKAKGRTSEQVAEPQTPARSPTARPAYRSSGAPTPNGTSPYATERSKKARTATHPSTPTKTRSPSASSKAAAGAPPPASPATQSKALMLSKLGKEERAAFKRNDAERQQRRLEKKQKKKAAAQVLRDVGAGGSRDKVKLPVAASSSGGSKAKGSKGKKSFSGAAKQAKKVKSKGASAKAGKK